METHVTGIKPDTKDRLLDAAEELFLEKGFDQVSIRELAAAADVNLAAVNYHFQGKDNLYREVIKRRFTKQRDRILGELEKVRASSAGVRPPVSQVIRSLVFHHLSSALDDRRGGALLMRMQHELHSDSKDTGQLFLREMVAPVFRAYSAALLEACPGLGREQAAWVIASIVGQIHHFLMRWERSRILIAAGDDAVEVMLEAFPALALPKDQYIEQVTEHITRFCAAAVEALYPEVTS